jgi:hypothetical protein
MGYEMKKMIPKAISSDMTGEKKVHVPKMDREMGGAKSSTGATPPKGALSSDTSGERKRPIEGGVGMGKMDGIGLREASHMGMHDGRKGEMKGGSSESTCYEHKRMAHVQDM